MLKLKQILLANKASQAELARHLDLSPAAVAQLINHHQFPRSMDQEEIKTSITTWLVSLGIARNNIDQAFEEETGAGANSPGQSTQTSLEDQLMLLRKHQLTPAAKRTFNLPRNPFDEVRSSDEVFLTPEIRYVREAMRMTARHGGFMAVVGESGSGKSTLRRDLIEWIKSESQPVLVIEPYVLGMEDNDTQGKTLKAGHIAEAIMATVAPGVTPKRSPEARFRQVHNTLKESFRAGNRHILIIEEAHGLPIPTLKHLKRFFELEDGFSKLLGIVLIGQSELGQKLDERNPAVREVVQRCEVVNLLPLDNELEGYLSHRFRLVGRPLNEVMNSKAIEALQHKLTGQNFSVLYPLAIHNVLTAAMNHAAVIGAPLVTPELVLGV
ncbi:MAG: AAA family ATPase [Rheinheimera sp.]|nr:AAA family ATPase [Rheinheimera sp.]